VTSPLEGEEPAAAAPASPTSTSAKGSGRLWRWGLALSAMGFVLYKLASDPQTLARILAVPSQTLVWLALLFALSQLLLAFRLSLTIAFCGGAGVPMRVWFRLIAVGQLLNTAAPQLGSVYRAVVLKREHGVTYLAYASGLLAFVWLDLVFGVLLASTIIAVLEPTLQLRGIPVLLGLLLLLGVLSTSPAVGARLLSLFSVKGGFIAKAHGRAVTALATVHSVLRAPGFLLRYLLLTVFVTLEQVTTLWLLFRAVGADLPVVTLLLFQVIFKLSTQVVVTPGNLGVTEILFGLLSHGVASTLEQGLAVSVLYRGVSTVMVVVLGTCFGGVRLLFGGRRALEAPAADVDGTASSASRGGPDPNTGPHEPTPPRFSPRDS
jgi:uncharacterized membrane protein YbhN (UPF0104 family)